MLFGGGKGTVAEDALRLPARFRHANNAIYSKAVGAMSLDGNAAVTLGPSCNAKVRGRRLEVQYEVGRVMWMCVCVRVCM